MSKHKKQNKKQYKHLGDITINDFANSTVSKSRPKKSISNVTTLVKSQLIENKSWEDKIEDFDGEFDFVEETDENGKVSYVIRKLEHKKRTKSLSGEDPGESCGNEYPIDIWFLLSEYIRPEDVGRFAGICKTASAVVHTAKFWFSLYKRYYVSIPHMPEALQPECLLRKYGIRQAVIRALYFMYSPFANSVKAVTTFEEHPDVLKRRQCVSMWHITKNKQWIYYFKMKSITRRTPPHYRQQNHQRPDLLEMLDDVDANQDEDCRILQVTSPDFICVPPVLGLMLTSVTLTLSQGFRHHRLQMRFGTEVQSCMASKTDGAFPSVVLDPVINIRIFDWWHPLYPHGCNLAYLLNQE